MRDGSTHLLRLLVNVDTERRVFPLESAQCSREIGSLCTDGLEGEGYDGIRHEHRFLTESSQQVVQMKRECTHHRIRRRTVSEGIARGAINTKDGANFTRTNGFNILQALGQQHARTKKVTAYLHLVTVHADQAWYLDLLTTTRVEDELALAHRALVHTHVRELSIAAFFQLERERDEWCSSSGDEWDRWSVCG